MKNLVKRNATLRRWAVNMVNWVSGPFPGSKAYWEQRYADGGDSGSGSYRKFAEFKADVINAFVKQYGIRSIIEYGCGDGAQLELAAYPAYVGFDVSPTAIMMCQEKYRHDRTKTFKLVDDYANDKAELTMSLDVIYHLVEDEVFDAYMRRLFGSSQHYVIIYSSNAERPEAEPLHVRHRVFSHWVDANVTDWRLQQHIPNRYPYHGDAGEGSFADFYIYERK